MSLNRCIPFLLLFMPYYNTCADLKGGGGDFQKGGGGGGGEVPRLPPPCMNPCTPMVTCIICLRPAVCNHWTGLDWTENRLDWIMFHMMQRGSSVVISGKQGMQKVKVQFCIASLDPRPSDL